jgi:hypothetical protein
MEMRHKILALVALAALLVPVLPAVAATGPGDGGSYHFSATGKGAEAVWSTLPVDGQPVTNVVYTDTYLFTAEQAVKQDGTVYSDKFLFVDQISYKIDQRGNWVFVSETFGFAGGDDVSLLVDRQLTAASASASVGLQTCTAGRHGSYTCVDAGIGSVVASWVGQGDLIKQSGTFHLGSTGFTENGQFRGSFRNASADGSLNGGSLGASLYADIFSSSSRDIFICHGC